MSDSPRQAAREDGGPRSVVAVPVGFQPAVRARVRSVRVLWVGTDAEVGELAARQLSREHGIKVRVCCDLADIEPAFVAFRPDVTLMDLCSAPTIDAVVDRIRKHNSRAWVIAGTFSHEESGHRRVRRAPRGNLVGVVSAVLGARSILPQRPKQLITTTERNVISLVAEGFDNENVARSLGVSRHTVEVHLKNLYKKLNVHGRVGAVMACLKLGLIELRGYPDGWGDGRRRGRR